MGLLETGCINMIASKVKNRTDSEMMLLSLLHGEGVNRPKATAAPGGRAGGR